MTPAITRRRKSCDWIVCHDGSHGKDAYALECRRCGAIQRVATPISVDCYVAMAKAFERMHRTCKDRRVR